MLDSFFSLLFLLAGLLNLGLAWYAQRHRHQLGAVAFGLTMTLTACWPLVKAVDVFVSDLPLKIWLMKLWLLPMAFSGVSWISMMAQVVGQTRWTQPRMLASLSLPLLVMVPLIMLSPHPWFRYNFNLITLSPFPILEWKTGPLGAFFIFYATLLYILPLFWLRRAYRERALLSFQHALALFTAACLPLGVSVLFELGITPLPHVDLTPIAQSLTGVMLVWAIFHYKLFTLTPIARSLLFDNLSEGVLVLDSQNRVVDFNPAAERLTQLASTTVLGQTIEQAFAAWPELVARFRNATDTETEITTPRGKVFEVKITSISDHRHPLPIGRLVTFHDITARKHAEASQQLTEERLQSILGTLEDVVWSSALPGYQTLFVTPSVERLFGHPLASFYADPLLWEKSLHPDDRARMLAITNEAVTKAGYDITYRIVRPQGDMRWVHDRSRIVRDALGTPVRVEGILTDITARKEAEAALLASEALHRSVVTALQEGIVVQDETGAIVAGNASAERILGLTRDQLVGRTSLDPRWRAIHEDGSPFPGEMHPVMVTLRTGQPQSNVVMGVHKPDGSLTWININTQPLRQTDPAHPLSVVASFADITESKLAEGALRQQNDYLAALHAITLGLMERHEPEAVLETLLSRITQLLHTDHALICTVDVVQQVLIQKVGLGRYAAHNHETNPRGHGLVGRVWAYGERIVINDYEQWEHRLPDYEGLHAVAGFPLKSQTETIGVLVVSFNEPGRRFSLNELELLQNFANLAAVTLQNTQLYSAARRELSERRLAENIIQEQNTQLRALFAALPDLIFRVRRDSALVDYHLPLARLEEWPSELLVRESLFDSLPPEVHPTLQKHLDLTFAHQTVQSFEFTWPLLGGVREYEVRLIASSPEIAVCILRDITDRRQAEAALQHQNDYLSTLHHITVELLNQQSEGALLHRIVERAAQFFDAPFCALVLANDHGLEIRATTHAQFGAVGETLAFTEGMVGQVYATGEVLVVNDYAHWPGHRAVLDQLAIDTSAVAPITIQGRCVGALSLGRIYPGQPFDANQTYFLSLFAQLAALVLHQTQLHAHLQIELEDRKRAEADYRALFENVPLGIYRSTPDGQQLRANPALARFNGYTSEAEQLQGVNNIAVEWYVEPERREEFKQLAETQEQILDFESEVYRHKTREKAWIAETARAVRDAQGRILYYEGTVQDITERKRAEATIRALNAELRRSNADLEQFAYAASHDLQEPLRMITSYSQLLVKMYRGRLDADAEEYFGFVINGAKRMSALIKALLEYSRVGRHTEMTTLESTVALQMALDNLRFAVEDSAGQITHAPLPMVHGNLVLLTQLFQNLISNALKFRSPERPPHIHVDVISTPTEWRFTVRDNGIGIAPDQFGRLFQVFSRLHTQEEYPGTGIGLATCRKIVERHGGRIWVESQPNVGTTFYFTLPIIYDGGRPT